MLSLPSPSCILGGVRYRAQFALRVPELPTLSGVQEMLWLCSGGLNGELLRVLQRKIERDRQTDRRGGVCCPSS